MKALICALLLLFASVSHAGPSEEGARGECTQVASSTAGTEIVPSKRAGAVVTVDASAVPVWFFFQNANAECNAVSSKRGWKVASGATQSFLTSQDQWTGKVCGILDSGAGPATVCWHVW
jgi:hypothetical protein